MSGGRLVVLDRSGAAVKMYELRRGLATLGSRAPADIRIMLPEVCPHHATITVHNSQTVIRNVGEGETLVNGHSVTVAALKHKDVISIGNRHLRWEYSAPTKRHRVSLSLRKLPSGRSSARAAGGGVRRASTGAASPPPRTRTLQLVIEMSHRASMPASSGGKQVAIVQPQRRDNVEHNVPRNTTQATLWIESRKSSPRRRPVSPAGGGPSRRTLPPTPAAPARGPPPAASTARTRGSLPAARGPARSTLPPAPAGPAPTAPAAGGPARRTLPPAPVAPAPMAPSRGSMPTAGVPLRRTLPPAPAALAPTAPAAGGPARRTMPPAPAAPAPTAPAAGGPARRTMPPAPAAPGPTAPTAGGPARRTMTPAPAAPAPTAPAAGGSARRTMPPAPAAPATTAPTAGGPARRTMPPAPAASATTVPAIGGAARRSASARRSTPLRLTVLKRAQSATKMKVVKIEAPSKIDHTKQAAIMLMTGHTPRARPSLAQPQEATPSEDKKPSPVGETPAREGGLSGRGSPSAGGDGGDGITPKRSSVYQESNRSSGQASGNNLVVTILDITDSDSQSVASSSGESPSLPTPKKSALKDFSKKSARKTESIKFDLSNLEIHQNDTTRCENKDSINDEGLSLHYSESTTQASVQSPSPRRSVHSRSGRMLEQVGAGLAPSPSTTLTPTSQSSKKSNRASVMLNRVLDETGADYTPIECIHNANGEPVYRIRTLPPRKNVESLSIVDLVSIYSDTSDDDCSPSVYNSLDSVNTQEFETPNASNRKSRSTINPSLLGCSTPYASTRPTRSTSIPDLSQQSTSSSGSTQRSKSLATPENRPVSAVSAPPARRESRSRSRINDTDLVLLDDTEMDDSPKSSRRPRALDVPEMSTATDTVVSEKGTSTPENRHSPVDAGTPVLSIQSFLDSSRNSNRSSTRKGNKCRTARRKTVGVPSEVKRRSAVNSKSLGITARRSILHYSFESVNQPEAAENKVTPRGSVRLEQEAVKNQHSTAKKPQSRRSIIDDLERSDIVKQLFNSPVKRKLSRSMTEFETRNDDDDAVANHPARRSPAAPGRSGGDSPSDLSGTFTPERFVSPIGTPSHSPNLSGIKRLFQRSTPENYTRNLRVERNLQRKHKTRKSIKNDLSDVGGVKELFRRSPTDDLRNVSGVKRTVRNSPRNDLTDVRGVGRMFRHGSKTRKSHDVSGLEELFNESSRSHSSEELFDRLLGKPTVRKVYSRTFSTRARPEPKRRKGTFHVSLERIPDSVEVLARQLKEHRRNHKPLNITKEMQKLVTSTVDGEFPFLASRTRNSSLKKSASELYSAHTLPIKKRALASPRAAPAPRLPLKKRAVLHSTPMKGRHNVTMNASELGRVSPIRALDYTHAHNASHANVRTTRKKPILEAAIAEGGPSEAKTRKSVKLGPKASPPWASPPASAKAKAARRPKAPPKKVHTPPKRVTRNRNKFTTANTSNTRRASLVIGKKAPVMSPQAAARASTPPRRATTRTRDQKPPTPAKKTRVAKERAAVVVPKPFPKLKPQAASQAEDKPKRTRRNVAVHFESPKESQSKTRGRKNDSKGKENKTDNVVAVKPKRGRNPAAGEVGASAPATRRGRAAGPRAQAGAARGNSLTKADQPGPKQPKGRAQKMESADQPTARHGRNAEIVSEEPQPKSRGKKTEPLLVNVPKTRRKKIEIQLSPQPEPVTRGRRVKADKEGNTVIPVPSLLENRRKRKTVPEEEVPAKVAKTVTRRGRKLPEPAAPAATPDTQPAASARATQQGRKTRGKKVGVKDSAPAKATRGRKVAQPEESPVAEKRKRKTKLEASPVKGKKASPSVAKRARLAEPAAAGRPRAPAEEGGANGRSRRRPRR